MLSINKAPLFRISPLFPRIIFVHWHNFTLERFEIILQRSNGIPWVSKQFFVSIWKNSKMTGAHFNDIKKLVLSSSATRYYERQCKLKVFELVSIFVCYHVRFGFPHESLLLFSVVTPSRAQAGIWLGRCRKISQEKKGTFFHFRSKLSSLHPPGYAHVHR